jgi:thiol-disulfide isomerase/thioredoxin
MYMNNKYLPFVLATALVFTVLSVSAVIIKQSKKGENAVTKKWQWDDGSNPGPMPKEQPDEDPQEKEEPEAPSNLTAESYEEGLNLAKQHKKKLLVIFFADWCPWCVKMEQDSWSNPAVKQVIADYVVVKLNSDNHREEARKFGINYLPAFFLVDSEGSILKDAQKYLRTEELLEWLS